MVFGDTDEYKWVAKNAYKYGFILRYPKNRSDITGTANEPWHLRYVGKDVAKKIVEKEWTFEEYCLYNNVMSKKLRKNNLGVTSRFNFNEGKEMKTLITTLNSNIYISLYR